MNALRDTWVMAKRSLRHTTRSIDTIITVAAMPIATMLMMVYVFGGAINTGPVSYIDFAVPGVIIMTVVSGIAYAALRLNNDINKGIISRFKCMPIASSSILGGHAVSSVLSNLFSVFMVMLVALAIGFRSPAGVTAWLEFGGILVLFTAAMTWLAIVFGLLAKTAEGAGSFSYILMFLIFISSAFIPTGSMNSVLRAFADHQPMTPIIQTMRSLLVTGTSGNDMWLALGWSAGLLVVSYVIALRIYRTKTI
jgi:ABC-2 type transport system permease protein